MIPKTINYIFGLDPDFCKKPFSYFHLLNVISAKKINPKYEIKFHILNKPNSPFFKQLENFCEIIDLKQIPNSISGKKFAYSEHICDLIRLEMIRDNGGIYLDLDTVCVSSFDNLLKHECVMGMEYAVLDGSDDKQLIGLCNAVIMSKPNNKFLKKWTDEFYKDYKDEWNYNCVQMPYHISKYFTTEISIEPQCSFFKYSWDSEGRRKMFFENSDITDCYSLHLWETKNFDLLSKYDDGFIFKNYDTISNIYKKFL